MRVTRPWAAAPKMSAQAAAPLTAPQHRRRRRRGRPSARPPPREPPRQGVTYRTELGRKARVLSHAA
eukprot:5237248-Prymnesium_polylepis.1